MEASTLIAKTISELRQLQNPANTHPTIQAGCLILGWKLSPPYPPQWDYWHCTTLGGGVIRFDLEALIRHLESLPPDTIPGDQPPDKRQNAQ